MRFTCLACLASLSCLLAIADCVQADGPADNSVQTVRPIPPLGIAIDAAARAELEKGLQELQASIGQLQKSKSPVVAEYLPDVQIFDKALSVALFEDGFFEPRDLESAKQCLSVGLARAKELQSAGLTKPTWCFVDGSVGFTVRGYRSKLDDSIQPYGVAWNNPRARGDVWCRGRSEKGLELQFIAKQMAKPDPAPVEGVWMIYPMGRYCNANKLAGEVDTLETLEHAMREYPIDSRQVAIRGFSMGGAAAWHLAVHYPDRWFAATPGAGFSETPRFLQVFQSETLAPAPWEQTLWQMYDCDKWALNLKNLPTIAYSGAIDRQKQAADVMAEACWNLPEDDRFELTHVIAPNTAHKITPEARSEIEQRLETIHQLAMQQKLHDKIWFTTYTLKYNRCHWLTITGLQQHWHPATVKGALVLDQSHAIAHLSISGASEIELNFAADELPAETLSLVVLIDGKPFSAQRRSDLSWRMRLQHNDRTNDWHVISPVQEDVGLHKRHDLQGPIDDAFMDGFVFVKPNANGMHAATAAWVQSEMERAVREWHRQMRGDVRVVTADQLTADDVRDKNLILWGDPTSNSKLSEILERLPLTWDASNLTIGHHQFDAQHCVPAMIYPNPLAPNRYVVLNSGLTYREYDYLNNARQVPKLPDWAIVDVRTPPDARWPGKILAADFFTETWTVK